MKKLSNIQELRAALAGYRGKVKKSLKSTTGRLRHKVVKNPDGTFTIYQGSSQEPFIEGDLETCLAQIEQLEEDMCPQSSHDRKLDDNKFRLKY